MSAGKLRKAPGVVQLPGGVRLTGVRFKIIDRHENGSPKTFEIMPPGSFEGDCVLFADEEWIRRPVGHES